MAGPAIKPMEQFLVHDLVPLPPVHIGALTIDMSITNSVAMMFTAAIVLTAFLIAAGRGAVVPGRMQAAPSAVFDSLAAVSVE